MRTTRTAWRVGLMGLALATSLSGCSSLAGIGSSTHGNANLTAADVVDVGGTDAASALKDARAHFRNSDFGYSATLYQRAVELDPKNPEAYVGLGASYDRLGRFDLADKVYAALFALSGGTAQYYNNLGYSFMLRGELGTALANFRKAKALDPDNVVIANNIQLLSNAAAKA